MEKTIKDVAEELAQQIDHENGVILSAEWEISLLHPENGHRRKQLIRDKKRAESKIVAFKEALEIVMEGTGWRNVDEYLASLKQPRGATKPR